MTSSRSTRHSSLVSLSLLRAAFSASSHLVVDVGRSIASSDTKQQPYPTVIVCLFFSAGTNTPYLLRCSKLELFNTIPPEQDLGLISSVTSTDFRKVIFSPIVRGFLLNERYWILLMTTFVGLPTDCVRRRTNIPWNLKSNSRLGLRSSARKGVKSGFCHSSRREARSGS